MATLQETFAKRQSDSASKINNLYDKQYASQAQSLKSDYDQNLANKQAEAAKIAPQYRTQANTLANSYEQQRRNANLTGLASGLGAGTGLQQQNALSSKYIQNYGQLMGQKADAINTANQGIADLTTTYNNALAKARSEANTKRDQALIDDYNKQQTWMDNQAANLAKYGNFDAYKSLYGDAQANNMRNTWISQNPEVAYRSGMISKDDYRKITGKDPQYQSIYD